MEQTLHVQSKEHSYPVIIGKNILHLVPKVVGELQKKVSKIGIIVDEKVATIHEEKLFSLKNLLTDFQPIIFRTKSGEKAKSFQSYYDAITFCINQGLDRNSLLIAFGGGSHRRFDRVYCRYFISWYKIPAIANNDSRS